MTVKLETTTRRYIGLSTDDKPTDADIPAGSSFLENDTGDIYRWDGENWMCPGEIAEQLDDPNVGTLNWILIELIKLRRLVELVTS